jgi:hypothetical protein
MSPGDMRSVNPESICMVPDSDMRCWRAQKGTIALLLAQSHIDGVWWALVRCRVVWIVPHDWEPT